MVTNNLISQLQFPSFEQLMFGAVFGTVAGLIIGLWLKSFVDKKLLEDSQRLKKLPEMTWYRKTGPLTAIWRMLGV